MAIMQYGILTLQPGFCSTHHLAIVGDRQDLCVFHVLRKKKNKDPDVILFRLSSTPGVEVCAPYKHWLGWYSTICLVFCAVDIFFCVYLFIDEKSGSKQAQNVVQHSKESEVRHYYRQAGWNFILGAYPSNYYIKTARDICQGV